MPGEDASVWEGFGMNPEQWKDALPDEHGFGVIREFCIRDSNPGDRFPRPIRQVNLRVERLDRRGVLEDGSEVPFSFYVNGNMERMVKDQSAPGGRKLVPAAKGNTKTAKMLANWIASGLPLTDFKFPVPLDGNGEFIPLPTETWTSPKTQEQVSENRVHVESAEGVNIEFTLRRRVSMGGGNEAHDLLEIDKILPPDFAVAEDQVERVTIKRDAEGGGEAPPGSEEAGAPSVDADEADKEVAAALDGKGRGDALQVLLSLSHLQSVDRYVSGLSGDASLIDELVSSGLLTEDKEGVLHAAE